MPLPCTASNQPPRDIEEVRSLFQEYAASLTVDLCFQSFEKELAELPGTYDPILVDSALSGCVALRPLADGVAEMKRLYVRPQHRGTGLGRQLVAAIIKAAEDRNYRAIRLDTLPELQRAIALYRTFGFQEIAPYNDNPVPGVLFLELKLPSRGRILGRETINPSAPGTTKN